jgi:hypothetical protein
LFNIARVFLFPNQLVLSLIIQNIHELESMYAEYAASKNYAIAENGTHILYDYAFDAMWAAALGINRSLETMPSNMSLDNFTYDSADIAKHLYKSLLEVKFLGASVSSLCDAVN